jgi:septal ring factor EnvC (AmiA/AmiB activator)
MAVFFLLLAFLLVVVVGAAGLENTDPSSATLFDRSFSQLSEGQLLVLAAALGFLVALFLFLAFGASRTRRSRRKELKSRRRDAEGRVDELERENARLKQELTGAREELETIDRDRSDAVAERDPVEATADRDRSDADARRESAEAASLAHDPTGATAVDEQVRADSRAAATPPEPTNVRRERLDDRTGIPPAHDEHARAAADEEAPRR